MSITAENHHAIQNTIASYCFALDNKDWPLLSSVFTPDADAFYPFPGGHLKGVDVIANRIKERLTPITSQHALSTQHIDIHDESRASATTYFSGIHFGTKKWEGQNLTAYGKYVDELVKTEEGWRISKRECKFMGRVGEERVMEHS